jgi:hypothetical protein
VADLAVFAVSRGARGRKAAAGGGRHQRLHGAAGGGHGFSRALSLRRRRGRQLAGIPDLGISTMEDVLTDVRRITDATALPLLVDIDTGWGGAFNIARTIRQMIKAGAAAVHIEDQVGAKRCGHRPGKELVPPKRWPIASRPPWTRAPTSSLSSWRGPTRWPTRAWRRPSSGRRLRGRGRGHDLCRSGDGAGQYTEFRKAVGVPILANITEFGQTPLFTREELGAAAWTSSSIAARLSRHECRRAQGL